MGYVAGGLVAGIAADAVGYAGAIAIVAALTAASGVWVAVVENAAMAEGFDPHPYDRHVGRYGRALARRLRGLGLAKPGSNGSWSDWQTVPERGDQLGQVVDGRLVGIGARVLEAQLAVALVGEQDRVPQQLFGVHGAGVGVSI